MAPRISEALKETLRGNTGIKEVYFTEDGNHHFTAFRLRDHNASKKGAEGDTYYSQLNEGPEMKGNIYTGKTELVPFKVGGKDDPRFLVTSIMSAETVLAAAVNTADAGLQFLAEHNKNTIITREQILAEMGLDARTLDAIKQMVQAGEGALAANTLGEAVAEKPKGKK
jgi:hypothetical protein